MNESQKGRYKQHDTNGWIERTQDHYWPHSLRPTVHLVRYVLVQVVYEIALSPCMCWIQIHVSECMFTCWSFLQMINDCWANNPRNHHSLVCETLSVVNTKPQSGGNYQVLQFENLRSSRKEAKSSRISTCENPNGLVPLYFFTRR